MNTKSTVLFLCTGNSARSQIAQALLTHKAGDKFEVFSAGTQPEPVDERTIQSLTQYGIPVKALSSKSVSDYAGQAFDYVITLCNKASAEYRSFPGAKKQLAWDFPDPKTRHGTNPFATTINELNTRLAMFLLIEEKSEKQSQQAQAKRLTDNDTELTGLKPTDFYKTFTDNMRLKTLMLTHYHGELCVCELMEALAEESQPKVSRNLAVLKKAKVITDRKHGQWVFYRINAQLPQWAKTVIAQTTENNVSQIANELQRLDAMQNRPDKASFCK